MRIVRAAVTIAGTAAALAGGAVALAQDPAAPAGNYGGGVVLAPPKALDAAGNMLIGLRVTGNRVTLNASMGARCESLPFSGSATLGPGGTFKVSGTKRDRLGGGRNVTTRYEVEGTVSAIAGTPTGAAALGAARVRNRVTTRGRGARTCTSGQVRWAARRPAGDLGPMPAFAKARYYGTTSQRREGPRRAIVMRVSGDGTKLTRALYDIDLRCEGRTVRGLYDAPRRNLPIKSDGTVSDRERFEFRDRTTILRFDERFQATLGQAGVRGTFSATSRLVSRRTGRTIGTCRTGTVRFTAST